MWEETTGFQWLPSCPERYKRVVELTGRQLHGSGMYVLIVHVRPDIRTRKEEARSDARHLLYLTAAAAAAAVADDGLPRG